MLAWIKLWRRELTVLRFELFDFEFLLCFKALVACLWWLPSCIAEGPERWHEEENKEENLKDRKMDVEPPCSPSRER